MQRILLFVTWIIGALLSLAQVLCILGFYIGRADDPEKRFSIADAVWVNLILAILSIFQDIIYLRRPSRDKLRVHLFIFWADITILLVQAVLTARGKIFLQLALLPSHMTFHRTATFNWSNFLSGEEPFFWTDNGHEYYWGLIRSIFGRLPETLPQR